MVFNLTDKLNNDRPAIELNGRVFDVDNSKDAVLKFSEMSENTERNSDAVLIPEAMKLFLGEEAAAEIDAMHLSWTNYTRVFFAVVAMATEDDYAKVEERFQKGTAHN